VSDHWRDANDRSRNMRLMLSGYGIELDEPKKPKPPAISILRAPIGELERDAIRAHLESLGCPEWAIASCPSFELACTYKPEPSRD
jgi:hypothetical protein